LPGHNFQNAYTYDAASNRTSLTAPDTSITIYGYDTLNRLNGLANSWAGSFGFSVACPERSRRNALSRRTQLTRPNGITTNYNYDSLSHLLSVLHQAGTNILDGASYTYDTAGNRTSKGNYLNGVTSNYTYDPLYQLTQVTQGGSTTETYSYDFVGNRLSSSGVPNYSYNSSNELTSNSNGSYAYDANGNTLSDPSGKSYTWDFENRLTQAVVPGTGTVTFKYDPFGRRIQKYGPLGTTNYLYDGRDLVEEVDSSGNILARYTQFPSIDQPLAELRSGVTSYYEQDGIGSISALTNSTGALANTYTYDAFGKLIASSGMITNPFQYTGREFDQETGIYQYRYRYYDQNVGRFINEDPYGVRGGINFYRYAFNSPTNLVDPWGLAPNCVMTSSGLQCDSGALDYQMAALLSLFPGTSPQGGSMKIPMSCDAVQNILANSGYYTGGLFPLFTSGNWATQNPFLFWDILPFVGHLGGQEWRNRWGFHFRRKYTLCDKSCTLDEFHIDEHNPMYDPFGHVTNDIPKAFGLGQ
jgi:RHS repeat-associated protein